MQNKVQDGRSLNYTPTAGNVSGGDLIIFDNMVAVAATDIPKGGLGACEAEGVFALPKKAGEAIVQGKGVYVDGGDITATAPFGDALRVGVVWQAADAAAPYVNVKINV